MFTLNLVKAILLISVAINSFNYWNSYYIFGFGMNRTVINPVEWSESTNKEFLVFRHCEDKEHQPITKKQLLKMSVRLRDIARYLGTGWPTGLTISSSLNSLQEFDTNIEKKLGQVTDIRDEKGDWVSLSVGQSLKLITEELEVLKKDEPQPLFDFLVRYNDSREDVYYEMSKIPLDCYCLKLAESLSSL